MLALSSRPTLAPTWPQLPGPREVQFSHLSSCLSFPVGPIPEDVGLYDPQSQSGRGVVSSLPSRSSLGGGPGIPSATPTLPALPGCRPLLPANTAEQ